MQMNRLLCKIKSIAKQRHHGNNCKLQIHSVCPKNKQNNLSNTKDKFILVQDFLSEHYHSQDTVQYLEMEYIGHQMTLQAIKMNTM